MMSVPKNNGPIVDPALCRCCRAIKKCRILTAEYTWMGKKEIYADMVMDCYGILLSHVDDNERDSGVCATCVVRLREAIAFRHQVLQCEELFLQAKLEHHDEEEKDENRLKKFDLELKTEPKDYSDHNSLDDRDDRDDPCPDYSDDDADDNKPLKKEEPKPEVPPPVKEDNLKSEDSMDFNGDSSSDSDEPIKKKVKRKAKETKSKANGAKKKPGKAAKKQKAETGNTETNSSETIKKEIDVTYQELDAPNTTVGEEIRESITVKIEIETPSDAETITETITGAETGAHIAETTVLIPKKKRPSSTNSEKTGYEILCEEMELNEDLYFQHYNMSKASFDELFDLLKKSIKVQQRLAICLRYLKTGESTRLLGVFHGLGRTTASKTILDVSKAIWNVLQPLCMPIPTDETWWRCEEGFQQIWKLPNCIGSLGGRHLISKSKPKQQSVYSSLKCYSSAVFIAIADPLCNLVLIDIGNYAKRDERDIFERTSFYKDFLCSGKLLPDKPLPNTKRPVPQVFIGSDGLPLKTYMLCEYPKQKASKNPTEKYFNERINAARTVDKVFDMLMSNWRVFSHPTECSVETSVHLTKAVCCLHNYIRSRHLDLLVVKLDDNGAKKGSKKAMKGLMPFKLNNRRAKAAAITMRDVFAEYFSRGMSLDGGEVSGVEVEPSYEKSLE